MPKIDVNKIKTYTGHRDAVYALAPASEYGHFLSAAGDGLVVSWSLDGNSDGELVSKVPDSVYAIHLLPGVNRLIVGHNFNGLHVIDLSAKNELASLKITGSYIFDIQSYDGNILAACGDGMIYEIGLDPLRINHQAKVSPKSARTIAINEQRGHYAAGFSDNYIRVFNLFSHDLILEFEAHKNSVFTLTYSPSGEYLLSGSRDAYLKIWDVENGYEGKTAIPAHMYAINHISYSPDGSYFATCSLDKSVKIWSAEEFRLLKVIDRPRHGGHSTSVNKLYWSGYNNWLISCSDDKTISVWNINFNA
jgi:WD40 repeat protein